jgi:ComF family protein
MGASEDREIDREFDPIGAETAVAAASAARRLFTTARDLGRRGGRAVLDLMLPPVCLACRTPVATPQGLCAACWSRLRAIERPYCERLGIPFGYDIGAGALSAEAIADPPVFDRARAAVLYEEVARDLVQGLKYHDRTELAGLIGRMTARAGRELTADADVVVPLPLHRWRLWTRKFNQAGVIALEVGRISGVPVDHTALERVRRTRPQVGLGERERAENVRGAFRVPAERRAAIAGRKVVLVDDVLTTGATVSAATRALRRAGAARVDVLTFARVAPGGPITI